MEPTNLSFLRFGRMSVPVDTLESRSTTTRDPDEGQGGEHHDLARLVLPFLSPRRHVKTTYALQLTASVRPRRCAS